MNRIRLLTLILACFSASASAGTLKNGSWSPSGCGSLSEAPLVDDSSIDAYNNSLAAITEWEQVSASYYNCMINEANQDSKAITNSATRDQLNFRQTLEAVKASADQARARFTNH